MKTNRKRIIALIMLCATILSSLASASANNSRAYSSGNPSGLLLYVGDAYSTYSASDIAKLSDATTEFVLSSGNYVYNHYDFGTGYTQIITQADINAITTSQIASANSLTDITEAYTRLLAGYASSSIATQSVDDYTDMLFGKLDPHLQSIDSYYDYMANTAPSAINADMRTSTSGSELDRLADLVVSQVQTIVNTTPNATIWLPLPHIPFSTMASNYETPFNEYMDYLEDELGSIWNTNIRGYYWGTEAVIQYYTPFNTSSPSTGFGNQLVNLMMDMDTRITSDGKEFLWIPYMESDTAASETLNRMGYVANLTTIFDYVTLQSTYYFSGFTEDYENLDRIVTSTLNNKVYGTSNTVIGGYKVSGAATIGYEMELDSNVTTSDKNNRYWVYTAKYANLKAYPTMVYAGSRDSVCGTSSGSIACYNYVNAWLGS